MQNLLSLCISIVKSGIETVCSTVPVLS